MNRIFLAVLITTVTLVGTLRCGITQDIDKNPTRESVRSRLGEPCKVDQGNYEIWSYSARQRPGIPYEGEELRWSHSPWCSSLSPYSTFYFWREDGKLAYWEDPDGANYGTDYSELKVREAPFPAQATGEESGYLFSYYGNECRSVMLDAGVVQRDYCGKRCTEGSSGWCLDACHGGCPTVEILVRGGKFADIRFPPTQRSTSSP